MKLSLKLKATLMIVMISFLIGSAGTILYYQGIDRIIMDEYETRSLDITGAMAEILDADKVKTLRDDVCAIYEKEEKIVLSNQWGTPEFEEYLSHYSAIEKSEAFLSLREQLWQVQDVIHVDCLYIIWFDVPRKQYVYLVDAAHEEACPPGCVDPLYTDDPAYMENLDKGCPPNVSHTEEYGYLMTTCMPIRMADGEIVGFASADLSMSEIIDTERNIIKMMLVVFGIITVLICLIGIFVVDRTIIRHINKLSETAEKYTANKLVFSKLDIHTGDEIEKLADSIKRMERDIKDYYSNLLKTKNDLEEAREDAEVFKREASIDALTGVYNKRAYDVAAAGLDQNREPYAIAVFDVNRLKKINDRHGHDKGDIAIQSVADLISEVFANSPVYRIGGDEFAVILTGSDYEARERLIGKFRDEVRRPVGNSELKPWEKTGAACGYAVYDGQTDNAASVFERADENMYENKKELKDTAPFLI